MIKKEHYPKNFQEFIFHFRKEEDCREYIFEMRWTNGFRCPRCNNSKYWLTDKGLIHCATCEHQTSITIGTIFHGTRKPLLLWFYIMWRVIAQKTGVSAYNLMGFMGLGSHETAWT